MPVRGPKSRCSYCPMNGDLSVSRRFQRSGEFRIDVDSETEGALTVFGPLIGWPRRGAGGRCDHLGIFQRGLFLA